MLRDQARKIWQAGVDAVASDRLVAKAIRREGSSLAVCGHEFDVKSLDRILVLGAGKAGAGMAAAVEAALSDESSRRKLSGWVNVPADCVRPLSRIVLHAARPAGVNEPTEAGVLGTQSILELARGAGPNDLVIVLISGGGSALAPAPISGISLADKQAVTRFLMRSGASIQELNTVRKHLSEFKGGGLARAAARARAVVTLIISDVIGDPLDVIASGPTVEDTSTAADALAVLERFGARPPDVPANVVLTLRAMAADRGVRCVSTALDHLDHSTETSKSAADAPHAQASRCVHVIGNNATALAAAASKARELGYVVKSLGSKNAGEAQAIGRELAELCRRLRDGQTSEVFETSEVSAHAPVCVLSGGEPVVKLVPTDLPRKGGRNQEVALAALQHLWRDGLDRIAILSGGTDGEDGPTNAAGAVVDEPLRQAALANGLDPAAFLAINNSYPFFEQTGGLLLTGPTHTNVMDLRVALVR